MHPTHRRQLYRLAARLQRFGVALLIWMFITHATGLWGR